MEHHRSATVYVTRYALSSGGIETWDDAHISMSFDGKREIVEQNPTVRRFWRAEYLGVAAFESREEALRDAIKRADKKLASIEKQAAKVRKLRDQWAAEVGS